MALYDSADITRLRAMTASESGNAAARDSAINNMGNTAAQREWPNKNYVTEDGAPTYPGATPSPDE